MQLKRSTITKSQQSTSVISTVELLKGAIECAQSISRKDGLLDAMKKAGAVTYQGPRNCIRPNLEQGPGLATSRLPRVRYDGW